MKKGLGMLIVLLITGCFGNVGLDEAILNTKNADSYAVTLNVRYYETEFVDYYGRTYQATEEFDFINQRMKTFDFQSENYLYYEIKNNEMGFLYREEAGEWLESQIPVSVRDYFKEATSEINFLANEDFNFKSSLLSRNNYQVILQPQDFFTVTNDFYEVTGEIKFAVVVAGDFIDEITYTLQTQEEKIFEVNMKFFDYNETRVTLPMESGSDLDVETLKEVALALENAVLDKFQDQDIQTEEMFLFRDGQLTDDSPSLDYTGFMPTSGVIIVNEAKEVRMALHANKYCVTKKIDGDVVVTEATLAECRLP